MNNSDLAHLIPESIARQYKAAPMEVSENIVSFWVANSKIPDLAEALGLATGKFVKIIAQDESLVKSRLTELYGAETVGSTSAGFRFRSYSRNENTDIAKLKNQLDAAPIVKLVDEIITSGIKWGASDIHIEPFEKYVRVRYRLDGKLQEVEPIPLDKKLAVISRIKIMSELDVAERRRPQDG